MNGNVCVSCVVTLFQLCLYWRLEKMIVIYLNIWILNTLTWHLNLQLPHPSPQPNCNISENIRADLKLISHNWIKTRRQLRKMKKLFHTHFSFISSLLKCRNQLRSLMKLMRSIWWNSRKIFQNTSKLASGSALFILIISEKKKWQ